MKFRVLSFGIVFLCAVGAAEPSRQEMLDFIDDMATIVASDIVVGRLPYGAAALRDAAERSGNPQVQRLSRFAEKYGLDNEFVEAVQLAALRERWQFLEATNPAKEYAEEVKKIEARIPRVLSGPTYVMSNVGWADKRQQAILELQRRFKAEGKAIAVSAELDYLRTRIGAQTYRLALGKGKQAPSSLAALRAAVAAPDLAVFAKFCRKP